MNFFCNFSSIVIVQLFIEKRIIKVNLVKKVCIREKRIKTKYNLNLLWAVEKRWDGVNFNQLFNVKAMNITMIYWTICMINKTSRVRKSNKILPHILPECGVTCKNNIFLSYLDIVDACCSFWRLGKETNYNNRIFLEHMKTKFIDTHFYISFRSIRRFVYILE